MSRREPDLRASDQERDLAVERLRAHCAAGRLSPDELEQRTEAALAARAVGGLRRRLADLPELGPPGPRDRERQRRARAVRRLERRATAWVALAVVTTLIWLLTGAGGDFWPRWVVLAGAIHVGAFGWHQLGPGAARRHRLGRGSAAVPRGHDDHRPLGPG